MEVSAQAKFVRTSSRKLRLIRDALRGLVSPKEAIVQLRFVGKRASQPLVKVINSAVANALANAKLSEQSLRIKRIDVGEGPTLARFRAGSRGTAKPIQKRVSHVRVVLEGEV